MRFLPVPCMPLIVFKKKIHVTFLYIFVLSYIFSDVFPFKESELISDKLGYFVLLQQW